MSLNAHDDAWHRRYEALVESDREAVKEAFDGVTSAFRNVGIQTAWDDRAEALIAAITRYMVESRG